MQQLLELFAGDWHEVREMGATFIGFAATVVIWGGGGKSDQLDEMNDGTRFVGGLVMGPLFAIGSYFVWPFFAILIGALVLMMSFRLIGPMIVGTAIETRHAVGRVVSRKKSDHRDRIANTPQDVIEDGRNRGMSDKEILEQVTYLENARHER